MENRSIRNLIVLQVAQILTLFESIPIWVLGLGLLTYLYKLFAKKLRPFILRVICIAGMAGIVYYYKTLFDPEAAVSLLILIGSFKILEINTDRDVFISLLVSILFIASMALFLNTFFTFILMTLYMISIFIIWKDFINQSEVSLRENFLYILRMSVLILPFTIILFVFFPRFTTHFLPFGSKLEKQEIGFNEEVKNSKVSSLNSSSRIAFRAKIDGKFAKKDLYWRGTIHTNTDGLDWDKTYVHLRPQRIKNELSYLRPIEYTVQMKQQYKGIIFTLDHPKEIGFRARRFSYINDFFLYRFSHFVKVEGYSGKSDLSLVIDKFDKTKIKQYLQVPKKISSEVRSLVSKIKENSTSSSGFAGNIRNYLSNNGFEYTLSPGKISSLEEFLVEKKGFCTHFASMTAIFFRIAGYPSRLVSGFQGGEYNDFGDYWIVRDNDAHTWVEYYQKGIGWKRYDPTSFISPMRLELGGEGFFATTPKVFLDDNGQRSPLIQQYYRFQLILDNFNYRWNLFVESFDRSFQEKIASYLKLKVNKFYFLLLVLPVALFGLYYIFFKWLRGINFSFKKRDENFYYKKMLFNLEKKTNKPIINSNTPSEHIEYFELSSSPNIAKFFDDFDKVKYGLKDINIYESFKLAQKDLNSLNLKP